jgi:hypothetical protein
MDKECRTCKQSLDESKFSIIRTNKTTGQKFYRPDCKSCIRKNNNTKPNKPHIKKDNRITKDDITMPNLGNKMPFTDIEISTLRLMINEFKNKPTIDLTNLIEILKNKTSRTKTIMNLDNNLKDNLKSFADTNNINMSDSVNYILSEYFKKVH